MRNANTIGVRRTSTPLLCLAVCVAPLFGATLERLSLDDLTLKSTDIVRVKVVGSYADFRGSAIYTHWKIQVSERWKGGSQSNIEVQVPGGSSAGVHQDVPGAPKLVQGAEYLLFLWTSKSGATYITGWGQGVFSLSRDANSELIASRAALGETMLDRKTWLAVKDEGVQMRYSDMAARVSTTLAQGTAR